VELDAIFFADAVSAPPDGKFYVHGAGFTRYEISELPAPIPFSVLARFRVEAGDDLKEHRFKFTLIGPAGVPNVDPIGVAAFPPEETLELAEGEEQFFPVALDIHAFAVRDGLYHLEVELDGKLVRRVPLAVVVTADDAKPKKTPSKAKRPSPREKAKRRR
jgi:hypothetical protein